jgi:polar amino acid transport system substrate-binding protein
MRIILLFLIFFFSFSFCHSLLYAQPTLSINTENFPPFSFEENGSIVGAATEIVEMVMKSAGLRYSIELYPWARCYTLAKNTPNTFIYAISRRANREKHFIWIGVITPAKQSFFSLKERGDIQIIDIEDAHKYRIGTTVEDARDTYLINKGFNPKEIDRLGGKEGHLKNYQKLKLGRIDLWPMPDAVAYFVVRRTGDDPEKTLRKVYEIPELSQEGFYLAANLQTDDEVIKKIRKHLIEFKKSSAYAAILKKWDLAEQ